ncbi:DUF5623 domain-containing protein [Rheinheimera maricola]|uniref:DUF5623 domain-containing protein n=1 Tax=Rheinheimera maricola TaxID=2793282 RepID=A0ABS7XAY8_9GAMM|nr:DUF5623 domain-containing protein [Rheinheimera maricola]MBZ9612708.1 DUF5623 domain-containing protein [Rheinheimera maricola]
MLNKTIQPSTIGGIKRHAKQIKKSNGLSHYEALDIAAQNASFENFAHARNRLQHSNTVNSSYQLFFTCYWYDRKIHKAGREVLEIKLSTPLFEIASKSELKNANSLGWFRPASPDHLVDDHVNPSQEAAVNKICKAVRVLRFMEATGLKPSRDYNAAYPNKDHNNKLPDSDHSSEWCASDSGQIILIDEPYLDPIVDGKRAAWAKKHNWYLQASKWAGMYYPGMSNMFVSTDASTGYDFKGLMSKIDNIPYPITEENWTGMSSKGHETFLSPLCVTPQDKKRAVAKGTIYRESSSKTQPMRRWDAPHNERRPNAVMSVESHQLAARLIKAVQQSAEKPIAVNRRLSSVKSKLEDWFFSEYERGVTDKYDLFYYGDIDRNDPFVLQANSSKGVVSLLQQLKDMLLGAYVDCGPLRKMIGKINTSIKLTSNI